MTAALAGRFRRFADVEATGRSPVYVDVARRIAADPEVLGFLAARPEREQQPNLLLAVVQHLAGPITGWAGFRAAFDARRPEVADLLARRTTQTNVPGRCATLLPVLAALPQPLALVEIGASAGLCLQPDRYGYDFGAGCVLPGSPVLRCAVSAGTPVPRSHPEIAWRAGLDLHPLDVTDPDDRAWLEALVWPGEGDRLAELRTALDVAAADPPPVHRGDLRTDLPDLVARAPRDATLVVLHTAVLVYVPEDGRRAFGDAVRATGATWIAAESPAALPFPTPSGPPGRMLLCRDEQPLGWADPHGAALDWIA